MAPVAAVSMGISHSVTATALASAGASVPAAGAVAGGVLSPAEPPLLEQPASRPIISARESKRADMRSLFRFMQFLSFS